MAAASLEEIEADVLTWAVHWQRARKYASSEAMKGVMADPKSWTQLSEAEAALSRAVDRYLNNDAA